MSQLPLLDVECSRSTCFLTLNDCRVLAYTEWGDRTGYPVFYFHGSPSSRLEGALADHDARKHRFRLIAPDRPGFGLSTFQKDRKFRDWPRDVCVLADALGIREFGVVGHSGAGPHLFACGAFIPADRLKFIGGLAPWGPVDTPEITQNLTMLDRFFCRLARRLPWLMRLSFAPVGLCARYWSSLFLYLLEASVSPPSRKVLQNRRFKEHFRQIELEAFRQGSRGAAHEALICYREWDFDIEMVKVPTHIWVGDEDIFVSSKMGEYLRSKIRNVDFHWAKGKGHLNVEIWDDILAACATHVRSPAAS